MNATGRAYMSSAVVGGMYVLRCAVGNSLTEEHHVREAWSVVQGQAAAVLATAGAAADTARTKDHAAGDDHGADQPHAMTTTTTMGCRSGPWEL